MRLVIDTDKCEGFGPCADAAPNILELDELGYAQLTGDGTIAPGEEEAAHEAVATCPVGAISIRED